MKKIFLIIFLVPFFLTSCGSDEEKTENNNDTENVSITKDNSTADNDEQEVKVEKQEIVLDAGFKEFLSKFDKASLPFTKKPTGEETYSKIPVNQQITYLSKAEDLSKEELEEMAEYTDFFFVNNPLQTDVYNAIVYARFEMGSTYYFLCTYDNNGKLISNIDFAAYEMMGAGPQAGQEFTTKGTINSSDEIIVKSDEEEIKYKINDDGKIVKK